MDAADKFINNKAPKRITAVFFLFLLAALIAGYIIADKCACSIVSLQMRSVIAAVSGDTSFASLPSDETVAAGERICIQYGMTADMTPRLMESFAVTRNIIFSCISVFSVFLCAVGYAVSMRSLYHVYGDLEKLREECEEMKENFGGLKGVYGEDFSCVRRISEGISRIGEHLKYMTGKLNSEKDFMRDFLADFSHQIKTSIACIRLNSDMLEDIEDMPEEKEDELKNEIKGCFDDMEELVFASLRLARLNAGSVAYSMENGDLSYVCSKALKKVRHFTEEKNIKVSTELSENVEMCFDRIWLTEAVANIIKNSADHSGCTEISLKLSQTPNSAVITISDNGKGIPQEQIPKIFERFGKSSRESGMTSVGIGISIAEKIVRAHKGEILVYSEIGKGTVFEVVLLK